MPAGVAPPGFHGKKGRSGRKCYRDEQLRIEVIEKAWLKKQKRMTDGDATQIVVKDMTEKKDLIITIPKPIDDVSENHGLQENKADESEDKNSAGRDRSVKNSGDNSIPDSPGTVGCYPDTDEYRI